MRKLLATIPLVLVPGVALGDGHFWGQWQHGPAEFLEYGAWVSELDPGGQLVTATVACHGDVPYLSVAWLQGEPEQQDGQMQITVDGEPFWLNARYLIDAAEPAWTAVMVPEIEDALRAGTTFTVQVAARGPSSLRLNGSSAAIGAALHGCGEGGGYQAADVNFFSAGSATADGPLPSPQGGVGSSQTQGTEIVGTPVEPDVLRADFAALCPSGVSYGDGAFTAIDLDLDGALDLMVNFGEIRCEGAANFSMMQGLGFCGMQNCAVDFYVSSRFQPGGRPESYFNHMEIPPVVQFDGATPQVLFSTSGGSCPFAEVCTGIRQWNGSEMALME